jgi:hypothetical protein
MTSIPALPGALSTRDTDQLRMLVIGHYAVAGIQAVLGCMAIVQLGMGLLIVANPAEPMGPRGQGNPHWLGWIFIAMAAGFMLVSWTLAAALVVSARKLSRRQGYVFCLVVAFFAAMFNMPLGTALGACTLIVLLRPPVKAAFEANG